MIRRIALLALFFSSLLITTAARSATSEARVETLLGQMTLEEKLGQLIQYVGSHPGIDELAATGGVGCVFNIGGPAETNALQRLAIEKSRLRIPLLFAHDVIHG